MVQNMNIDISQCLGNTHDSGRAGSRCRRSVIGAARAAALAAGIPEHVPIQTINRFCSSGLMAVTDIANKIRAGQIDIGLAVGVESMSFQYVSVIIVLLLC